LNSKFDLSSTKNDEKVQYVDHIYSQDPLENKNSLQKNDENELLYESVDYETINQQLKPNGNIV
jgi:hypothetical protein